ncbi:succinate dehydrogenase assembly factor 1, mitochondrial [Dorcoceras hygrometricum]|uniref:Succinate dehydrogenase assembly factor 1, mitochondrial n=1 Tax=Dorcoceras hygrometricum TaxID=472368 RepID=A0A2Z7CQS7_9LAMI|nr:succinate dehydrogenase assembly factor 1, mitochondrial [Dorcoceras hygrometricum]
MQVIPIFSQAKKTWLGIAMGGGSSGPRLSGMQKQVLALYRGFLRAARTKSPEVRSRIQATVSAEFRHNSQIDRKNFLYIEYLLRRGKKQLDQLNSPDTVGLSSLNV